MSILSASYLSQSFGAADIFGGISVTIPQDGKIGLVGPNGIGKTTLLLILAGLSQPASGRLHLARGTRIGYLPQESSQAFSGRSHAVFDEMLMVFADLRADAALLRELEARMTTAEISDDLFEQYSTLQEKFELAGGYDYELRIRRVLTGLGFSEPDWQLSLSHLSGGQKTRALLARLLLESPDLLILDEPTNHLDVNALEWLEGVLKTWPGAVLVVSHDRYFLDGVVNTIWEMSRSGLERYRGNYSAYALQKEERWQHRQQEYKTLMERLAKEMDYIRRNIAGQRTQMAQGKLSRLAREVEAIHAGGLTVLSRLKSQGWAKLVAELDIKQPAGTVGELQQRISELHSPSRPYTFHMTLSAAKRSGDIVLRTMDLRVGYPGNPLFAAEDIDLRRRECAALIGPNGAGKTTFLRTILKQQPPLLGKIQLGASLDIAYFAQAHDELQLDNSVLDELLGHQPMLTSEARKYLAKYKFRGDEVYKRIDALSGGERGRLALALLALSKANFLLLDEPTNHLDIPAQEALQAALEQFEGTILMVTHDRYLVNRLATQIWELADGRLRVYSGNYQAYQEKKTAEKEWVSRRKNKALLEDNGKAVTASSLSKNAMRQRAEAVARLETAISETEAVIEKIGGDMQMATQNSAFDKIQALSVEYAAAEAKLEELLVAWETMAHG